jgi:hypothetical protein
VKYPVITWQVFNFAKLMPEYFTLKIIAVLFDVFVGRKLY